MLFYFSGVADICNGMAMVTVNNLVCETTYTIIAGGLLAGNLVGPKSSHGTIMSGHCRTPSLSSMYYSHRIKYSILSQCFKLRNCSIYVYMSNRFI